MQSSQLAAVLHTGFRVSFQQAEMADLAYTSACTVLLGVLHLMSCAASACTRPKVTSLLLLRSKSPSAVNAIYL